MGERGQNMARAVVIGGPKQHWWRVLAQFVSVGLDHAIMWDPADRAIGSTQSQ
jgi:hypothetical protein